MQRYKIIILILVILALATGFLFSDNILSFYNNVGKNLHKFVPISSKIIEKIGEKTNLEDIIINIKKDILAPTPLNIGGKESNVVLTKTKIIAQTNIQRYNNGLLPPLFENVKLNAAAKAKAKDMFKNQYFEHLSPSGVDAGQLVKNYGYDYIVVGENLILGNFASEEVLVQHWMESPGHRANILNGRFTDIGVAIEKGIYNGKTVWIGVQEFSLPLSACGQPNLSLKSQIDYNKNELDQLALKIDAKRAEINNINPRSQKYNVLVYEYNQLVNQYNLLSQETENLILQYNSQVNIFNQCITGN